MPKQNNGKPTTFEQVLHLMIDEQMSEKGDMSFELKVISWKVDGKQHKAQLTKQQMSLSDTGEKRGGKAKGLSLVDLDKVLENLPAVYKALGGNRQRLDQLVNSICASVPSQTEPEPF